MKQHFRALLLCCAFLLSGCGHSTPVETVEPPPAATVPEDGNPQDITCLGSYSGTGSEDTIIARMEGAALTNKELQHWYWAEVCQYRQSAQTPAPDFSEPLDVQLCPLDTDAVTWQQYFLETALERWHTAYALIRHSQEFPLPLEEAYTGDPKLLDEYMTGMPATQLLYGYDPYYKPNTLHRNYLEALEQTLEGSQLDMAYGLNLGYMYFTTLGYDLEAEALPETGSTDPLVSFRYIFLPSEENAFSLAVELLDGWLKDPKASDATFAQLASQYSQDTATAGSGGLYKNLRRDQFPEEFAQWCFDESRQEGDTTLIPDHQGIHILYFHSRTDSAQLQAAQKAKALAQQALLDQIRQQYPMTVDYREIALWDSSNEHSLSDLLYPDIAHQRFPEVPLYLQQNYANTMYGEHKLSTNGCGVTSLAMLSSYLTDQELTPPELSARYGRYSEQTGTAGSLFDIAPAELGFYLIKKTYDWREARDYMQEGYPVIVCQYRGYWTGGGHYLVLERLTEDGLVQVRDSNLYNYRKLPRHKDDKFPWDTLSTAGQGYWIYQKKAVTCAPCTRCGDPELSDYVVATDYLCEKCQTALIRRNVYLQ